MSKCKHKDRVKVASSGFRPSGYEVLWCRECGALFDFYWTRAGRFSYRPKWIKSRRSQLGVV